MQEPKLKYKIAEILIQKGYFERARLRTLIRESLNIGNVQLSRKINARNGDSTDFTGDELLKIANILSISVNELYNNSVEGSFVQIVC